jgi:hypothetical protein
VPHLRKKVRKSNKLFQSANLRIEIKAEKREQGQSVLARLGKVSLEQGNHILCLGQLGSFLAWDRLPIVNYLQGTLEHCLYTVKKVVQFARGSGDKCNTRSTSYIKQNLPSYITFPFRFPS